MKGETFKTKWGIYTLCNGARRGGERRVNILKCIKREWGKGSFYKKGKNRVIPIHADDLHCVGGCLPV